MSNRGTGRSRDLFKQLKPPFQSPEKTFLLLPQRFLDVFGLRDDFGKNLAHGRAKNEDQRAEKRLLQAEVAAVAHRAAENAAQHVTAALVARLDAVGDGEAERAN